MDKEQDTKEPRDLETENKGWRKHWIAIALISTVVAASMYWIMSSDNPQVQKVKTDAVVVTAQIANAVVQVAGEAGNM